MTGTPAEETILNKEELILDPSLKEIVDAGVFYGRKKSKTHPRMRPFILATRNEMEIIDLAKTKHDLAAALAFITEKIKHGGKLLFVATQPAASSVKELAREFHLPAVTERWLGGTLTNFRVIMKRLDYYKKLKSGWASNAFEKYTKKERVGIERELGNLHELFADLEPMEELPDVLVVIDPQIHTTAIREARRLRIPIVAFANTDSDPDVLDYPVAGNTKARTAIDWFFGKLREAIREGVAQRTAAAAQAAAVEREGATIEGPVEGDKVSK